MLSAWGLPGAADRLQRRVDTASRLPQPHASCSHSLPARQRAIGRCASFPANHTTRGRFVVWSAPGGQIGAARREPVFVELARDPREDMKRGSPSERILPRLPERP